MANLDLVTYCGLYCELCAQRGRIPRQAAELKASLSREGIEYWGEELPGFKEFWALLGRLSDPDGSCPGCRQGGGPPFCGIRKCARERNIDVCVECDDYPCSRIEGIAKGYPTLIADGKRMKELGIDQWITEQQERAKTGFAYVDIRCYPYEVPDS
jgi:hypothetical protein